MGWFKGVFRAVTRCVRHIVTAVCLVTPGLQGVGVMRLAAEVVQVVAPQMSPVVAIFATIANPDATALQKVTSVVSNAVSVVNAEAGMVLSLGTDVFNSASNSGAGNTNTLQDIGNYSSKAAKFMILVDRNAAGEILSSLGALSSDVGLMQQRSELVEANNVVSRDINDNEPQTLHKLSPEGERAVEKALKVYEKALLSKDVAVKESAMNEISKMSFELDEYQYAPTPSDSFTPARQMFHNDLRGAGYEYGSRMPEFSSNLSSSLISPRYSDSTSMLHNTTSSSSSSSSYQPQQTYTFIRDRQTSNNGMYLYQDTDTSRWRQPVSSTSSAEVFFNAELSPRKSIPSVGYINRVAYKSRDLIRAGVERTISPYSAMSRVDRVSAVLSLTSYFVNGCRDIMNSAQAWRTGLEHAAKVFPTLSHDINSAVVLASSYNNAVLRMNIRGDDLYMAVACGTNDVVHLGQQAADIKVVFGDHTTRCSQLVGMVKDVRSMPSEAQYSNINVHVTGHSLGGYTANLVVQELHKLGQIASGTCFSAAGRGHSELNDSVPAAGTTHYYCMGDGLQSGVIGGFVGMTHQAEQTKYFIAPEVKDPNYRASMFDIIVDTEFHKMSHFASIVTMAENGEDGQAYVETWNSPESKANRETILETMKLQEKLDAIYMLQ